MIICEFPQLPEYRGTCVIYLFHSDCSPAAVPGLMLPGSSILFAIAIPETLDATMDASPKP
jgi:hypothetical protein